MSFALSTSWNAFLHNDAESIISEIKNLGFNEVELSFNLTSQIITGIETLVKNNKIKVVSLHNFCPIPDGLTRKEALPDCFSMSSCNEEERIQSVKFTKRTIETAARLQAKAVVLHCGRVEIPDQTRDLINLAQKGLQNTPEFITLRDKIISERKDLSRKFLDNTIRSLDELNLCAIKNKILLGVETRFYYREIPILEEIGEILDKFKGGNTFYWHDIGHAQLMEDLGFLKHSDFLSANGSRMIGAHLHDISNCRDHQAPGKGDLDFNIIKPYLKKDTLRILEIHSPEKGQDIIKAKEYLAKILNEK